MPVNPHDYLHTHSDFSATGAWGDRLGVAASIACAIHCAAMPFVIGFLPLLGLSFLADPAFHQWMVVICLALALLAFVPGWKRHRRLTPALVGLCGLTLISLAAFAGDDCCPTIESASTANATQVALVDSTPQTTANSEATGEAVECTAPCCAGGGADAEAQPPDRAHAEHASTLGSMWVFVTPLGAVFLVVGHLCNRHWSSRCDCPTGCCDNLSREQVMHEFTATPT